MAGRATSYDEVPYTSFAYPLTHPDRLATVGRLFGVRPPDVARARVLEIGCASGGNLIPMAEQLPDAELLGIDLSSRQVAEGAAAIAELGLRNVELRHADLMEVDASWGRFDYVICHGVFSWVPTAVQDRILDICRDNLAPAGVAFVSYNVYPGWHLRESVRHMMRFHVAQFADARERTEQAAALVDFLVSAVEDEEDVFARLLRRELDILARTSPDYLFHEHLEEHNAPCYFHQFAERLAPRGLQYLGEADVHAMLTRELAPQVADTLARISPDILVHEQYMDFVRNRQFRQTLLCRRDVPLTRNLRPELVRQFHVGFAARPTAGEVDLAPEVVQAFAAAGGLTVSSAQPVTKAALSLLVERWPDVCPFDELCTAACARLVAVGLKPPDPGFVRDLLALDLLACFLRGGVELRSWRPPLCTRAGPRPRVSAYARWQAARGGFATNRRHVRVDLDEAARTIVVLLDGTRDRDAIARLVEDGTLTVSRDDGVIGEAAALRAALVPIVEQTLASLAAHAMLVA
jgi:methyltransferase-like protein/trans-aconitate methyltransferase